MSRDRSLDEFAARDAQGEESDETAPREATEEESDETTPREATGEDADAVTTVSDESAGDGATVVTPAVSTYSWSASGAPCAACGTSTAARWRDGDDLVCADCKEW